MGCIHVDHDSCTVDRFPKCRRYLRRLVEAKGLTEKADSLTSELALTKELNVILLSEMGDAGAAAVKMVEKN